MTHKAAKVRYVKNQPQNRPHVCHWPGCTQQVPPAMWGCKEHWLRLPGPLRERIWQTYRPGQEKDGRPSQDYLEVAAEVQTWIHRLLSKEACHGPPSRPL